MKKYVLKEHVEQGLVDPKKPLADQPEYNQAIKKEQEEKAKKYP